MSSRPVLLAAGGTGGHLFPAAALAEELRARGSTVSLATDSRAEKYGGAFAAEAVHRIPSATLTSRSPLAVAATFARLGAGYADALLLLARLRPRAVIGFGGYPTLPPIIAARTLRIPTAIHEQNAVMGRANRLLSRFADRIALSFIPTNLLSDTALSKTSLVGIPVREAVLAFRNTPYHPPDPAERLRLLVFGGSQGAHFFSEVIPPALMLLPPELRNRLSVVQQAREEDMRGAQEGYRKANIEAVIAPFFLDLPERIASAHLVIARAGASTVAELTTVGRPALLVPLPHALDNDQLENATRLEQAGGGWCVRQNGLTGERLAKLIEDLLSAPARLAEAAVRSHSMARPDAVKLLADLVEEIARPQEPSRHAHA